MPAYHRWMPVAVNVKKLIVFWQCEQGLNCVQTHNTELASRQIYAIRENLQFNTLRAYPSTVILKQTCTPYNRLTAKCMTVNSPENFYG